MESLPTDVWIDILVRLDHVSLERLCATCRTHYRAREATCRDVAHGRWGAAFWRDATRRVTWRTFTSFRDELRRIHRFEAELRAHRMPIWTHADYARLWQREAEAYEAVRRKMALMRALASAPCDVPRLVRALRVPVALDATPARRR